MPNQRNQVFGLRYLYGEMSVSFNPVESLLDKLGEERARKTPIPLDQLRLFLTGLCRSGCDRVPLKVQHLQIPFYLAGIDERQVYLAHSHTFMVSGFSLDELEPIFIADAEKLQELALEWLDSPEGTSASERAKGAKIAEEMGLPIKVALCWPDGKNRRQGKLSSRSHVLGSENTVWVFAVESAESRNAVFRYGLSLVDNAAAEGLTMVLTLKPSVLF
jgi:hypothetical protein